MARPTAAAVATLLLCTWLLVASSAAAISCYKVDLGSISPTTTSSITVPPTVSSGNYSVCFTIPLSGTVGTTSSGRSVTVSGSTGLGLSTSDGINSCADVTANVTSQASQAFASAVPGVKLGTLTCCNTNLCNTGLGITFTQGAASMYSLPLVNVLLMLAVALVSFNM